MLRLANLLNMSAERLGRYVIRPLPPPTPQPLLGWAHSEVCRELHSLTDGFALFGLEPWVGFRLWGSEEYLECIESGGPIFQQSQEGKLLPIYGSIPHLASVSVDDGVVVATDWENYGQVEHGWRRVIAIDLPEYIRTVIDVREAYGEDEGLPADWWGPYASHGTRYDREP